MLHVLRAQIRTAIVEYCAEFVHREAMLRALSRPGFALSPEARCRAGVLTLNVCQAVGGQPNDAAIKAAAAVELHMAAAYMFDNVADQEVDPEFGLSPAEELALAIAILSCGAAVAAQAAFDPGMHSNARSSLLEFHVNFISACAGQFLDAHLERGIQATYEEALKMTSLKAGSLGRMAADIGASIATDDPEIVSLCSEFGFNLFTYVQLIDDLRDACPTQGVQRDLLGHKQTVPLVFLYRTIAEKSSGDSDIMSPQVLELAGVDVRREFESSGAPVFSAVVAETFLNRARRNLEELERRIWTVDSLEHLVSSVEITPEEIHALP